jgi:SAM-dependent methyltransferase
MCLELDKLPIIVCSNNLNFLTELKENQNHDTNSTCVIFVFIKRPCDVVYQHRLLKNTDRQFHQYLEKNEYAKIYETTNTLYECIADVTIDYRGDTVAGLAESLRVLAREVGITFPQLPPSVESIQTPTNIEVSKVTHPLWGKNCTIENAQFSEYMAVIEEGVRQKGSMRLLDAKQMREITAGGYQVFDTNTFPPRVDTDSLAFKKLSDLKWQSAEFQGKTVVDLGCLLGFFTFHALHLGASQCVGIDATPQCTLEANKIAVNYRINVCRWPQDRIRFVNQMIVPNQPLGFYPDIIVANSILHWWIIQNPQISVHEILKWLHTSCAYGVYFEGCVSAREDIMQAHRTPESRLSEEMFLNCANELFQQVKFIGRCSYNDKRIVVRLLK